jgi:hypothetical protein
MTATILAGCAAGAGLALLIVALWPAQRSLGQALAVLRAPRSDAPSGGASWQVRLGEAVAALTRPLGLDHERLRADLALLDRPLASQMARKTLWAAGGLAVPLVGGLLELGLVHVPVFGQVWDLEPQADRSAILLVDHGERYLVTVNHEVPAPTALVQELVTLAEQRQTENGDVDVLDDLVHECASKTASDINNAGLEAQITFLLEQLGEQHLRAELAKEDDDG